MMMRSDAGLSNHVVAVMARVTDIVAALNAKRDAAQHVAANPAAEDACAELGAGYFEPGPCVFFFAAGGTLHWHRVALVIDPRHAFVFSKFLCFKELTELLLPFGGGLHGLLLIPSFY
jgi:hypothetical protein